MRFVRQFVLSVCVLIASGFLLASAANAAPTASDVVKEFYATLTETMKQGPELGFDGRYKKLAPAITKTFNLPLMARYSVGPSWSSVTPENQEKLVESFSKFSISTYASRFTKSDGEEFIVVNEKPMSKANGFMVETKLKTKDNETVTLNYLVRPDEKGVLRIADVYLDASISELATRRAEFSSVIKREGFPSLLASLTQKSEKMKEAQIK
ncbi:MAG: ABC transporter substrate-binding protein [Alphaproteobacteria bacterium]|nr:ABC transporter substrate-binding protein [Alphaproteobacteria bacterium]